MNERERLTGTLPVVTASTRDGTVTVVRGEGSRRSRATYSFDGVFSPFSTQEEVFVGTVAPVIRDVLKGYESTVFAYGQTGTGKTHTMEGSLASSEMHGVIPRSAQAIFESLEAPQFTEHSVSCSYLEIYNEELCDLLIEPGEDRPKLEIREGKGGTFCKGLSHIPVLSAQDVFELMQRAQRNRRTGETRMNEHSSRSHCIFTLSVRAKRTVLSPSGDGGGGVMEIDGKLHMVDLAGSECAKTAGMDKKQSGTECARERERRNINTSLLTLGRVISMLKERSEGDRPKKRIRIPYRDSKLTRILQESLGGRCKTVIIATLSPSATAVEESFSTLNYAQAANGIVNRPVAASYLSVNSISGSNALPSPPSLGAEGCVGTGGSVEQWHDVECRLLYMKAQVEEAQGALARKHLWCQEATDRGDRLEVEVKLAEGRYSEEAARADKLVKEVAKQKEGREEAENRCTKKAAKIVSLEERLRMEMEARAVAEGKLDEATTKIHILKDDLAAETEAKIALEEDFQAMTERAECLESALGKEKLERRQVESELSKTRTTLQETEAVLEATRHTEAVLTSEALVLLRTLRKSVDDGDHLHSMVKKQNDAEMERRRAMRDFSAASLDVLEATRRALHVLEGRVAEHKTVVVEMAGGASDRMEASVRETEQLLSDIASNVTGLVASMKAREAEAGGILSTVREMALCVEKGAAYTSQVVAKGEEALRKTGEAARRKLAECAEHLAVLKQHHNTKSAETLSAVEIVVRTSRRRVADMVASAMEAIAGARRTRTDLRKGHSDILSEWEVQSARAADQIRGLSMEQGGKVEDSLKAFVGDMVHLDEIDSTLEEQRSFVAEREKGHNGFVRDQESILTTQAEKLENSHGRQKRMREDFVTTVMSGVQELVERQMETLAAEQAEQYASFKKDISSLVTINGVLGASANGIVAGVKETNDSLTKEAAVVRKNDCQAKEIMEKTMDTLVDIAEHSDSHGALMSKFSGKATSCVAEMEKQDLCTDQILEDVNKDGNACRNYLSETVLKETKEHVSSLTKAGSSIGSYSTEVVVTNSKNSLDELMGPRKDVVENFSQAISEVSNSVSTGEKAVAKMVIEQCDAADGLCIGVKAAGRRYADDHAPRFRADATDWRDEQVNATTAFAEEAGDALSDAAAQTTALAGNLDGFVGGPLMQSKERVLDVPLRKVYTYEKRLTSTPHAEEIIRCMKMIEGVGSFVGEGCEYDNELMPCVSSDSINNDI